jgi:hypothetical protein
MSTKSPNGDTHLSDREVITAIMAAIIYAGADGPNDCAGYTNEGAVNKARAILRETESQLEAGL